MYLGLVSGHGFGGRILSTHSDFIILPVARGLCTEIEKFYCAIRELHTKCKYYVLDI